MATFDESPRKQKPRRADENALRQAALGYLQRYPSSRANLRRVLARRRSRAAQAYGSEKTAGRDAIETILDECEAAGLLDDARYARRTAETWLARGEAVRAVRARLARNGVPSTVIDETLEHLSATRPDADLHAAVALVRRRRLGPYRPEEKRGDFLEKDLGVLARAGFTFDLARRVLAAEDEAALEELIEDERR